MFPYHDENETQRTAYVTFAVIGLNVVSWLLVQGAAPRCRWRGRSATSG